MESAQLLRPVRGVIELWKIIWDVKKNGCLDGVSDGSVMVTTCYDDDDACQLKKTDRRGTNTMPLLLQFHVAVTVPKRARWTQQPRQICFQQVFYPRPGCKITKIEPINAGWTFFWDILWLVVEPTHLKNSHFPSHLFPASCILQPLQCRLAFARNRPVGICRVQEDMATKIIK